MVNRYFPKNKLQMFWWWFAKSFLKLILPLLAPRNWSPYQLYEAQSEPSQTLKMELFAKIVNGFKLTLLTILARAHTHTRTLSHTHTHTHTRTHTQKHNFHFQHLITFFHCLFHFSGFTSQSNRHSENPEKHKFPQSILYMVCYFP